MLLKHKIRETYHLARKLKRKSLRESGWYACSCVLSWSDLSRIWTFIGSKENNSIMLKTLPMASVLYIATFPLVFSLLMANLLISLKKWSLWPVLLNKIYYFMHLMQLIAWSLSHTTGIQNVRKWQLALLYIITMIPFSFWFLKYFYFMPVVDAIRISHCCL